MDCFDDLDFGLHMQIFDLCIENKAEYVFNKIEDFHIKKLLDPEFNLDEPHILNALKDNQNLLQNMGSINSILDKYNKWQGNKWLPLNKKIKLIYNGNYKIIRMLGRFNFTTIGKGNYFNTINGRFKIEKITEKMYIIYLKGKINVARLMRNSWNLIEMLIISYKIITLILTNCD